MIFSRRVHFERRFPRSALLYFFAAIIFTIGYFLGVHRTRIWCREHASQFSSKSMDVAPGPTAATPINSLMIVIFSAPPNRDRRQVIRQTWLLTKGQDQSIRHFFVIGSASLDAIQLKAVIQEHNEHSDILILQSVHDSFDKLSIKLRETLRYLDGHYNFTFLLKVDDDSFARLDEIYYRLALLPTQRLYWGFFDGQAHVKTKGKWRETKWFLCDRYLPYAKGGGYIISKDLVHQLALVSDYLTLYQNEDVALGTWLSPFDLQRRHDPLFDTEFLSRGCHNDYLITHKQSSTMMIEKYKSLLKSGDLCLKQFKSRNSYLYNWKVFPSQCCIRNDSSVP